MIACAALLLMAAHGMAQTEKPLTDEEIAAVRAWMASHPDDGGQEKTQKETKRITSIHLTYMERYVANGNIRPKRKSIVLRCAMPV